MKILCIGNSFSQDATRYLSRIGKAAGTGIKTVNLYIGGCPLKTHYFNVLEDQPAYAFEFNGENTGIKVSIKTVHDAMKNLVDEGCLLARRGRYGTIIAKIPGENVLQPMNETSIFAKAEDAAFYSYQKIENLIKNYIRDNFEIGDEVLLVYTDRRSVEDGAFEAEVRAVYPDSSRLLRPSR